MRRIIVCGGREYANSTELAVTQSAVIEHGDIIIAGGARGADNLAEAWARKNGFGVETFMADWTNECRSAGPRRNQRMFDAGADLVIAFSGGKGTAHTVGIARQAGARVLTQ